MASVATLLSSEETVASAVDVTNLGTIAAVICPVCLNVLREPCTLPCAHSLCRSCVDAVTSADVTVRCPCCRLTHHVDDLCNHMLPQRTEVARAVWERVDRLTAHKTVQCERCEKRKATFACNTCDMLYCGACCELLHQGKMKYKHDVTAVDGTVRNQLPFCEVKGHGEYRTDLYDPLSQQFLCLQCAKSASTGPRRSLVPTLEAAQSAKNRLSTWQTNKLATRNRLKRKVDAVDASIAAMELAADQELANLENLFRAIVSQLERQAKRLSDSVIEHMNSEVTRLCQLRDCALSQAVCIAEHDAKVSRAMAQSDAVELIRCSNLLDSMPKPSSLAPSDYTLPLIGPGTDLPDDVIQLTFLSTTEDESVRDVEPDCSGNEEEEEEEEEAMDTSDSVLLLAPSPEADVATPGQAALQSARSVRTGDLDEWCFDVSESGSSVELSRESKRARNAGPDSYEDTAVLGTIPLTGGCHHWKLKLLNMVGGKRIYFGVTQKPFNHQSCTPHKRIWGWASNGCSLPGYERTAKDVSLVQSGEDVWLRFDAAAAQLTCHWPASGRLETVSIGSRVAGKPLFPVVVLAHHGNCVELQVVSSWTVAQARPRDKVKTERASNASAAILATTSTPNLLRHSGLGSSAW
eukprot:NODE_523_length_2148_cov_43.272034_g481_i0.p1 GENE.NODE_523_length_2148_cov_43.272034_g481_i0~~NODE_523_length_2148_cov_43.272034_g481_i0.p1  ORF type:complete len:635 (-),score=105.52 NODE_523_length_2148_cov_43.272034_g481_i0:144-2048(-)